MRKQKRKAGQVVRIRPDLIAILQSERLAGETWSNVIERLVAKSINGRKLWTLPSLLMRTKREALGMAIGRIVERGARLEDREEPIRVVEQ